MLAAAHLRALALLRLTSLKRSISKTAPSGSARSGRGARAQQSGRAAERQSGRAPWAEAAEGQRRQRGQRELAMRACVCVRACTQQQCKGALPDLQSETAALQSSSRS